MTLFGDRYEIERELGTGGSGTVYVARDRTLNTVVALKLLSHGEDVLAVREASALRALASDHVLPVLNAGVHRDVPFVATELARGGSVEGRLVAEPRGLDVGLSLRWTRQMLVGLEYCHRRGILHRDVTPSNIFLDSDDHSRLGDLGLAANVRADGTAARAGNQHVMAPEGFVSGRMNPTSEVFSAGASLWRMLTATWPYEAATEDALYVLMSSRRRPRLRDVAPHVPRSVASVVERALEADPGQRPQTAAGLREELGACKLTDRRWHPVATHQGHEACWQGDSPSGPITTCVVLDGSGVSIQTTRANGRRLSEGCLTVRKTSLGAALRRLFDHL